MIRRVTFALLVLLLAAPAHAGFNEIRVALETRLGSTMWIPMFGFVRSVVRIGHPRGVHDLQLAVFEGKGRVESDDLDRIMTSGIGKGYTPLVRVRSRREREATLIYAKPQGELVDLVVLTNDGEDTVLVRVVVDPNIVTHYLHDNPRNVALVATR